MSSDVDASVRTALTRLIGERARAPTHAELAAASGVSVLQTRAALRRLHDAHALLLHPGESDDVWVAHPFALTPGSCWVSTAQRGYWANCLYCALGVAAALRCDAVVTTRLGAEAETVTVSVVGGEIAEGGDLLFHLSTPVRLWWPNVIQACASFQPFRSAHDVTAWCARHGYPRGAEMTAPALWRFAQDWYGSYIHPGWRRRSAQDVRTLFEHHGLTGDFWRVSD